MGATRHWLVTIFRMAANHGRCAAGYVTDDHYRQLLSGDHLHHGLLGSVGAHLPVGVLDAP
jgi:hypothetical protein